jgi:hypothetical protein
MGLTTSSTSFADDGKVYPATFCQYWGAPDNVPRGDMVVSQFGRIINDNPSGFLGVVCPIIRDDMRAGNNLNYARVLRTKAWGVNRNCSLLNTDGSCRTASRCVVRALTMSGLTVVDAVPNSGMNPLIRVDGSNSATAVTAVELNDLDVPAFVNSDGLGSTGSMYVLFCQIAPDAELSSYYVKEAN